MCTGVEKVLEQLHDFCSTSYGIVLLGILAESSRDSFGIALHNFLTFGAEPESKTSSKMVVVNGASEFLCFCFYSGDNRPYFISGLDSCLPAGAPTLSLIHI